MSPIGKRFFNQELSGMMEDPSVVPGRSLTAQILGGGVGKLNYEAGQSVKRAIDNFGDIWHNKLLWDRVADLQMGLFLHAEDQAKASGLDPIAAAKVGGDIANLFAGSLPTESMSHVARFFGNLAFFSRSFTMGNLAIVKRMIMGMPGDAQAQIERTLGPEEAAKANSYMRRRAASIMALEIAVGQVGNSLLQDAIDKMRRNKSLSDIQQGYIDRWHKLLNDKTPMQLIQHPFNDIAALSSTAEHEPGKENRILWGYAPDGTGTYIRQPLGKVGEDLMGWMESPNDTLHKKEGTLAKPILDIYNNSDYFGHKVYNDKTPDIGDKLGMMKDVTLHILSAGVPADTIKAAGNLISGKGDKEMSMAKIALPMAGLTVSKGYPGGPEAGVLAATMKRHEQDVSTALPSIKEAVEGGDVDNARKIMSNLGMTAREQNSLIKHYENPSGKVNPKSMEKFERIATPEEKELMKEQAGGAEGAP
jgi:hypothetical protein